jgi:hypothetical protein
MDMACFNTIEKYCGTMFFKKTGCYLAVGAVLD